MEYPIKAILEVGQDANMEVAEVQYHRALRATVDAGLEPNFEIATVLVHRALRATVDAGFEAGFEAGILTDKTISAVIDTGLQADMLVRPAVDYWIKADLAVGLTADFTVRPGVDQRWKIDLNVGEGADFLAMPIIERVLHAQLDVGLTAEMHVVTLLRRVLGFPPRGELSILMADGERSLEGCVISPGSTRILHLRITGTRLDVYQVEFLLATENQFEGDNAPIALHKIYNSRTQDRGGIATIQPVRELVTDRGTEEESILQIPLLPAETAQFSEARVVWYMARLSDDLGELYKVARGSFTIAPDGED